MQFSKTPVVEAVRDLRTLPSAVKSMWDVSPVRLSLLLIVQTLEGLLPVGLAWLMKEAVDSVSKGETGSKLYIILTAWIILVLSAVVLSRATGFLATTLKDRLTHQMRLKVNAHVAQLDVSFFESSDSYDSFSMAQREIGFRPFIIVNSSIAIISSIVSLIGFILAVAGYRPIAAVALILVLIPSLLLRREAASMLVQLHNKMTPDGRRAAYFDELLTKDIYAKEIRLNGLAKPVMEWNKRYTARILHTLTAAAKTKAYKQGASDLVGGIMYAICLTFAILDSARGAMTVGELTLLLVEYKLQANPSCLKLPT